MIWNTPVQERPAYVAEAVIDTGDYMTPRWVAIDPVREHPLDALARCETKLLELERKISGRRPSIEPRGAA